MEASSALLAICAGNSPVTGKFPAQRPVTRGFDVFFDRFLNKRLRRHCTHYDVVVIHEVVSFYPAAQRQILLSKIGGGTEDFCVEFRNFWTQYNAVVWLFFTKCLCIFGVCDLMAVVYAESRDAKNNDLMTSSYDKNGRIWYDTYEITSCRNSFNTRPEVCNALYKWHNELHCENNWHTMALVNT